MDTEVRKNRNLERITLLGKSKARETKEIRSTVYMQSDKLVWIRYNFYIVLISGYFGVVLVGYLYFGVFFQSTLGIVSLALLPVTLLLGRTREYLRDWIPFLTLLLSYEALQGITGSLVESRGIISIYPLDDMLWGSNLTGLVQSAFYSPVITDVATLLYSLHLPLVGVLATVLWYSSRLHFKRYVYALLICSYFSLLVFIALPTSPPWYEGVASDLINKPESAQTEVGSFFASLGSLTKSIESDKFAAFPSLHAAYAVLFGYYTTTLNRRYGIIALPIVAGVLFSTIYLGQHYLIDLVGGGAVAVSAILIANKYAKAGINAEDETGEKANKSPISPQQEALND